jgi:acetylglutamate kinase
MIVVKYGGSTQAAGTGKILPEIAELFKGGEKFVIVHGGAPAINRELVIHQVKIEMVNGFRYTDAATQEIVQRTLSGEVLRDLVNEMISYGVNAVGLTSSDGGLLRAKKKTVNHLGEAVDLGLVGEVDQTDPKLLELLINAGYFPIISPVGTDVNGVSLNVNGDVVTGAIGAAIKADLVLFLTDVSGIYENYPDLNTLISKITLAELKELMPKMQSGMIPKVNSIIAAMEGGAAAVRIVDGSIPSVIKKAISGEIGTLVVN